MAAQIRIVSRLFDDKNQECQEGERLLLRTTEMDEPANATLLEVNMNTIRVKFDDPLLGLSPQYIRVSDLKLCEKSEHKPYSYD